MPGTLLPLPRPGTLGSRFRPRLEALDDRITPSLSFGAPAGTAVAPFPKGMAVGDLNGDGRADLVTANYYGTIEYYASTVSVLVNTTPDGAAAPTFTPASYFTGQEPGAVAVGDFNGDGRDDLVTANAGSLSVLLNTTRSGDSIPTFYYPLTFATSTGTGAVVVADFNRDGRADIAAPGDGGVWVVLNATPVAASRLTFAAPQLLVTSGNEGALVAGDFNADGRIDLAALRATTVCGPSYCTYRTDLVVLTNTTAAGAGTVGFSSDPTTLSVRSGSPVAMYITTGDFDGDGRLDFAASSGELSVTVLPNRTPAGAARPTLGSAQSFALGAGSLGSPLAGDFDGDGRADIAVPNVGNTVSVLQNTTPAFDPTLTFAAPQPFAVGRNPFALAGVDFNGDGRLDLASLANPGDGSSTMTVLPNTSAGPAVSGPPLVGQFGGAGVWGYHRDTGGWGQLTAANADAVAAGASGSVVASFGDHGVWYYQPTTGWYLINGHRARSVAADGLGNVVASFDGFGTAVYRLADGWSAPLTAVAADRLAVNADGQIVADFAGYGLYTYAPAVGWRFLNDHPITALAVGANGDVTVSFSGYGIHVWRPTTDWVRLTDSEATSLAVGGNGSLVAAFVGPELGWYTPTSGWHRPHAGTPILSVAADLFGNVFASLSGLGVYEIDMATGWRQRTASVADLLGLG